MPRKAAITEVLLKSLGLGRFAALVLQPFGNRPPMIPRTRFIPDACLVHFDSVSLV